MQKYPKKVFLNKAGDIAHKAIVIGCIGLSFYGKSTISTTPVLFSCLKLPVDHKKPTQN